MALLGVVLVAAALLAPVGASTAWAGHDGAMTRPFAREMVRLGDRDRSPYAIEHVRELELRLKRVGDLRGRPDGTFRRGTRAAVQRFQRRHGLRASGVANAATWRELLPRSTNNLRRARRRCAGAGWHICYDRANHQATLWRRGRLWNSWLVRGGSSAHPTRTGDFTVFRRAHPHRSNIYGSPMPYSQFFSGGQAFHGSRNMMNPYRGHSHGCVNMYVEDARQLWSLTHDKRLRVHVYGRWS
ncbi:MAG TPA: L,D-transpeptidase family protein [Nocardioidaceae bacterium]|nr:L,D-transpeptidase family protein [Nocardioidaceae bacterium]